MSNFVTEVQPPLKFVEPSYTPWVHRFARSLLPFWLRWRLNIDQVDIRNGETLARLYQQFQSGNARFMVAFRHPGTSDPPCIADLFWHHLPAIARQHQIPLRGIPHLHFIYDRGIPLWAGRTVGWLMSKLGGTPIRRGGLDRPGLRSIRTLFANGAFPMAAAPEGGTNGHNELVSPLEPGIAQFGFWCAEDMKKRDRPERVYILPLGIQYRFTTAPWAELDKLLHQLETDCGLEPVAIATDLPPLRNSVDPTDAQRDWLYRRLYRLGGHLLVQMERYYIRFYQNALPDELADVLASQAKNKSTPLEAIAHENFAERLQNLMDTSLTVAEQFFQLKPNGTVIDRCRRVEQAAWERIYRDDLQLSNLVPIEQGLADRIAEEADLRLWHMRLAEDFASVTGHYVYEKPTVERFADTLLLAWKTIARIKGDRTAKLPCLGRQQVCITVGEPICVSDRLEEYSISRRSAITQLTQTLQDAIETMVIT